MATAHKKDKQKVIDEVWTEARIRSFLDIAPAAGLNADFHRLLRAYQSMRLDDFAQFIGFFVEAGGNLNATNAAGQSLLAIVSEHRHGQPYAEVLKSAGAAA